MSPRGGPLESETCREFVLPALRASGWQPEQIVEQRYFTDGRIIAMAFGHRRSEGKRTDYLLQLRPDLPLAVVEAKREYRLPSDGLQQAMDYAELLGLGFAYASNGTGIVEHDYDSGRQSEISDFPSPDELWARHQAWRGTSAPVADAVALPFNRDLRNPDGSVKRPRYYQAVRWRTAEGRDTVREALAQHGISLEELAAALGQVEADAFDVLVHVAWNGPLASRRDRVNRLKVEHRSFLEQQAPRAREVLEALLEQYANHGVGEIDDLASLEVPPLSDLGTPVEIAQRFGEPAAFSEAVRRLGDLLYAT